MNALVRFISPGLLAIAMLMPPVVAAAIDEEGLQRELIAPWIVTIQGESKLRSMHIKAADKKAEGAWVLVATYGWPYTERQSSVKAELTATATGYRLELVTQANSLVVAESADLKNFVGTFRPASGRISPVSIEKVSPDEFSKRRWEAAMTGLFIQPGPDVPATCAAFVGRWSGRWQRGGIGDHSLWVTEVNPACQAKTAYLDPSEIPQGFTTREIKDGNLAFVCNSATNGTCIFRRVSDELWVDYSNPSGGRNQAVFKRIAGQER